MQDPTPAPSLHCTAVNIDRYNPNLGGCCRGLAQCAEQRPTNDPMFCDEGDAKYGVSCWSTVQMCRQSCQANVAPTVGPTTKIRTPTHAPSPAPPTQTYFVAPGKPAGR